MNYKNLSEIADVQSGLVLSRKEAKYDTGKAFEYKRLNLRSVNEDGSINSDSLDAYFSTEKLEGQFLTAENDIVMRLFSPLCPVIITKYYSGLVVPSQLSIIRVKSQEVFPAFLYCYLSQRSVLKSMAIKESGQAARGIKISTLSDIKIPLLPMNKQKTIAAYGEMHIERKKLYLELIHQYDLQADAVIGEAIGGEEK